MDRKKIDSEHKRKYISSVVMFDIDRERKLREKYKQRELGKNNPHKEKTERDVRMALEESKKRIAADIFDSILQEAIDENGVIAGETFINNWFPIDNYDVFLSYSHDDEELALLFAGFLKYQFGLKVFIDKMFWGSADVLLRKLDNKYCKNDKRNA